MITIVSGLHLGAGILTVFFYNLDIVRVNVKTARCLQQKLDVSKINTFKVLLDLACDLIKPCLQERNRAGLSKHIQRSIN